MTPAQQDDRIARLESHLHSIRDLVVKYGTEEPERALRTIGQRVDFALGDRQAPGLAILEEIESDGPAAPVGFELHLRVDQPSWIRLHIDPLTGEVQAPAP